MTQPLAGKQILIVEDEPVFRSLLHGWLTSLGATTFQAEDGKDALHKMTEVHPDLMICDISMPRMNGLELVETLRNRGEQLPILMISATENMADIAKALPDIDVLIDGPFVLQQKDLSIPFRGSKNQRLVDVKRSLETGNVVTLAQI